MFEVVLELPWPWLWPWAILPKALADWPRHDGTANYLLMDGHAERMSRESAGEIGMDWDTFLTEEGVPTADKASGTIVVVK